MRKFALMICGFVLFLISIYFVPWFSVKTSSQSSNKAIVIDESRANISSNRIYGSVIPLKYNGEDLREFIVSQPLPEIWIIITENENTNFAKEKKIEISPEARMILYRHWIKALEFRYITEIAEISENVNYDNEATALFNSTMKTENLLLKTPIENEDKRNFSADEVSQLLILTRDKADEIIKEINQNKIKEQK